MVKNSLFGSIDWPPKVHGQSSTPRKSLSQRDRELIWKNEFGSKTKEKCPICKKNEINSTNFAAGHRTSLKNGGSNLIRNYRPICTPCNSKMGSMNMRDFIKKYYSESVKTTSVSSKKGKKSTPKKSTPKTTKSRKRSSSSNNIFENLRF
jgi:5-methylcytosine-specific restriction endonuclease McrA